MKKSFSLFLYVSGFALIGHSHISGVLPIRAKILLVGCGFGLIACGAILQWKWNQAEKEGSRTRRYRQPR